jgi:histidinol phosphatase-like enzyme
VPEFAIICDCRKPNPGMLKSLIEQWHPELSRSFMLGDSDKDAEAGAAVGVRSKKIQPSQILYEVKQLIADC